MGSRTKRIWLYIILIIVALCITSAAVSLTRIPNADQQLKANSSKLTVRIITPLNESHWQVGMPIPISASALGDLSIQSMELWVDGNLKQSENVKSDSATLIWMVQSLGEHTLLVRVRDAHGNVANSNAVRVIGIEQNLAGMYAIHKAKPGDTVAGLAANFGTTSQTILGANPNLNSASPIPDGTAVKIPAPIPPPLLPQPSPVNAGNPSAPNTPTQKPSSITPNPFLFWIGKLTQKKLPNAPDLSLNVNQCSVTVLITNHAHNAYGLYIYRLDPNSQAFHRIATLAPNPDSATPIEYTDSKLYGSFSYYVSAFDAVGEAPSKISQVQITDTTCETPFWSGLNLQLLTNTLTSAKYDKAYFYLEVNNQNWGRVPKDPNSFLSLTNGIFDATEQINANVPPPIQGQETVVLDAWGWQGGNLVHIGKFTHILYAPSGNGNQPSSNPVSGIVKLEVCSEPTTGCTQYQDYAKFGPYSKISFRWSAPPNTYGIYQVWSFPLAASQSCPVNDPGVIYSGLVGEQNGSNTFTIDFTQLHTTATEFSVRVLALDNNGQSVCEPSNVVGVAFNPPSIGQMPDPYSIQIASIDPGQLPNPGKPGCVVLTKNDLYKPQPPGFDYNQWIANETQNLEQIYADPNTAHWAAVYEPWPVGSELCPPPYQPPDDPCADSFSLQCAEETAKEIGSGIENGANQLSQDFATAKNWAVGQVESVIPGCSDSSACSTIVSSAVNAGLVELGIPPNVPNFDDLKQQGISYAADQILDQVGVSCTDPNDPCNQLVQLGHDKAKQEIVDALNQALDQNKQNQMAANCISTDQAQAQGIQYSLCMPPDIANLIQFVPASDSVGAPAVVTLEIGRDPNIPDSALPDSYSCSFKIHSSATNDSWIGQQIQLGSDPDPWNGTEIKDTDNFTSPGLFNEISESIPKNVPFAHILAGNAGVSGGIQVPVTLTSPSAPFEQNGNPNAGWWIDQHWQYDYYVAQNPGDPDDWSILYRGADATFTVTESCSSSAGSFTDVVKATQTIHINK